MLTYREAAVVKASVPALKTHGETVTALFYSNLLSSHPELNNMFNSIHQASGRQPRALTAVILNFAAHINHTSELAPKMERIVQKHCSLGVQPAQYSIVGKFLLQAFAEVLGPAWTPELHSAWSKAYFVLAKMLIGRESQVYADFGRWRNWRPFRIERRVKEAHNIYSLYLFPCDRRPLVGYEPGQYISLRALVPWTGYYEQRQFSLSDTANRDYYRVTVRKDKGRDGFAPGTISNILIGDKKLGDIVEVSHPSGEFHMISGSATTPLVFISAGIGATPLIAILNGVVAEGQVRPISWIHCSPRKAPFEDHVRRIAASRREMTTKFFRSRATRLDDESIAAGDEVGRLDLTLVYDKLHLDHTAAEYYICGPEEFMTDLRLFFLSQGVPRERLICELFETGESRVRYMGL